MSKTKCEKIVISENVLWMLVKTTDSFICSLYLAMDEILFYDTRLRNKPSNNLFGNFMCFAKMQTLSRK